VEELLIQELRQLGKTSMRQWATQAEERVSHELKGQDPTIRSRKKNAESPTFKHTHNLSCLAMTLEICVIFFGD
jgi:hypothetical protein